MGQTARAQFAYLLLYKLQLLGLEQLLGNALRARLGTQTQVPQLLAERRCVLVEEAGQLYLKRLDVGLDTNKLAGAKETAPAGQIVAGATHMSRALDQVKTELNDDVILTPKYLRDLACDPSAIDTRRTLVLPCLRRRRQGGEQTGAMRFLLLHDLQVDLGHVNLLAELRRELGALEELRIHPGGHYEQPLWSSEVATSAAMFLREGGKL